MFVGGALTEDVSLALRVLLLCRFVQSVHGRFVQSIHGWSFGERCGYVEKWWILREMILEFEQFDLICDMYQLLLLQTLHLFDQSLFEIRPRDQLPSRPRDQLPHEVTQQFIFHRQPTKQNLFPHQLLLSAILQPHS